MADTVLGAQEAIDGGGWQSALGHSHRVTKGLKTGIHKDAKGRGIGRWPLLENCPRHSESPKENGQHHWEPSSASLCLCFPIFKPHGIGV